MRSLRWEFNSKYISFVQRTRFQSRSFQYWYTRAKRRRSARMYKESQFLLHAMHLWYFKNCIKTLIVWKCTFRSSTKLTLVANCCQKSARWFMSSELMIFLIFCISYLIILSDWSRFIDIEVLSLRRAYLSLLEVAWSLHASMWYAERRLIL